MMYQTTVKKTTAAAPRKAWARKTINVKEEPDRRAVAEDAVYDDYKRAISGVVDYLQPDYSPAECFMLAVSMCRRLLENGRDAETMGRELDRMVEEYGGDRALLTIALLICRQLTFAVAQSGEYEDIPMSSQEWTEIRLMMLGIIRRSNVAAAAGLWHRMSEMVGTVYPEHGYGSYRLPDLVAQCRPAAGGEIASLVETTLQTGNIADCENLKNLLHNFDHTQDNRYKAELDTLIAGINRLRHGADAAQRTENNYYLNGSVHNDQRKNLTVNSRSGKWFGKAESESDGFGIIL